MATGGTSTASRLLDAYFEMADDLKRFFTGRLRSAAAADDLLQELYVKVAAWPAGVDIGSPTALLYRMASNLMLDHLRTERRGAARDAAWVGLNTTVVGAEAVSEEANAEQVAQGRQRAAQLAAAIQTLPPQTRLAFTLNKLEGLTQAEIARRLRLSPKTVEKQVSAGLRRLAAILGEHP
jgi:RNA polymerase sigma factor (sigma-70 family)